MRTFGKRHALQIIATIFVGFLILSVLILIFPSSWLDLEFSEEIQEHHNPIIDLLMKGISWFGQTWTSVSTVFITAMALFISKNKKESFYCLSTLLIGVITYLVKILINRPRPEKDLVRVIVDAHHQSFPSGHVSFYIVFFGFIAFVFHHKKWLHKVGRSIVFSFCIFLILTVPVSRIYLGAHWFTDVLGGFLLGTVFLCLLLMLYLNVQAAEDPVKLENRPFDV